MKNIGWGVLFFIFGLSCAGSGICAEPGQPRSGRNPPQRSESSDPQAQVRLWLSLQSSGQQAGPPQTVQGRAASAVYERYLNSFKQPVPAFFYQQSGASTKSQ